MLRSESSAPAPSSILPSRCRVIFGADFTTLDSPNRALAIAAPVLWGAGEEELLAADALPTTRQGCTVFDTERETAGFIVAESGLELETATRELYRRIFSATSGRHLYRIWNYVPRINAVNEGLENYRRFCRGRSLAFEDQFGAAYQRQLPSASAVGALEGPLAIAFLAGVAEERHFENPQQVPAFEYPTIYGPRAPSFSRATLVGNAESRKLFISGTAAIRGHATIATGDLSGQLACTRENLALIAQTAGAGPNTGAADNWQRMFKVYVRHPGDLPHVRDDLERHLLRPDDTISFLHADLCRTDLLVEIEAALTR